MTDDRLRQIADFKTRPLIGEDEVMAMADELLALRVAVRALSIHGGDFAIDYPAIAEDIARAIAAVEPPGERRLTS